MTKALKTNVYPLISFFLSFLLVLILYILKYKEIKIVGIAWILFLTAYLMISYYKIKRYELRTIGDIYRREVMFAIFFLIAFFALHDLSSLFDSDIMRVFAPYSIVCLGFITIFGDYYYQKELLTGKKEEISKEELIRILIILVGITLFAFVLFYISLYW